MRELNAQGKCLLSNELCIQLMASGSFQTALQWAQAASFRGTGQSVGLEEFYFELLVIAKKHSETHLIGV